VRLKPVEDAVAKASEIGRNAMLAIGPKALFLWLGKLFYGILYKELMLLRDRSDPTKGTIITEEFIRNYRMHRFFLQQARGIVELKDFNPGTTFIFDAQRMSDDRHCWDFVDSVPQMVAAVRVGRVAVIASLADGGAQLADTEIHERYYSIALHPIQFREICARVVYRASTATRTPKYVTMFGKPQGEDRRIHQAIQLPLGGLSAKPLFEEFIQRDYAGVLSYYTGAPLEVVFAEPDKVMSWLDTPDGGVRHMDFRDHPYFPTEPA
jgi:hypothetical protein